MIEFIWLWAFALLPVPLLVRWLTPAVNNQQQAALWTPTLADFGQSTEHKTNSDKPLRLLLAWLIWSLLISAIAQPYWYGDTIELPISGRDLMLAVDLSGSMKEKDFQIQNSWVDRLTATKYVATDFIERRESDRVGLILFGDQAYTQTPLTFDRQTVKELLNESAIGLAGERTAIGDAIGLAIKRLENNPDNQRVLILLTDGANTTGELQPLKAAELAAQVNMKIYTIGIGADEIIRKSFFGSRRINPSRDLDEKTLKEIARKTGGLYFRARNTKEFASIYDTLDQLEPIEQETQSFRPSRSLFHWPLGLACVLTGILLLLRVLNR